MKQKTKKLLQLSFSLGFLTTTALVATSCKQPMTVVPKPTDPSKPTDPKNPSTGNPDEPSTPTEPVKPIEPAKSVDTTEAKNKLKEVISKKDEKLAMYADYSAIKEELEKAYSAAELVSKKDNATQEELTDAKNKLDTAIKTAETSKTDFNSQHQSLVEAYNSLKNILNNKDAIISQFSDPKYFGTKEYLIGLHNSAESIIENTLQPVTGLNETEINRINQSITDVSSTEKIETIKQNVDGYVDGKLFEISSDRFIGDFAKSEVPTGKSDSTNYIIGYSAGISANWRYAKRKVKDNSSNSNITNVAWIYNLAPQSSDKTSSYDLTFDYYGGKQAILYFPYKIYTPSQNSSNIALQYKLNEGEFADITQISDANIDEIKIAEIQLSGLKFGTNKISFSVPNGKQNPIIGNMYIATFNSETAKSKIYDSIFGIEHDTSNPNSITVNIVKGYGLANYATTNIKKIRGKLNNEGTEQDYYVLNTLGNRINGKERYYSFYVNILTAGNYEVSALYNSTNNRNITFWQGTNTSNNSNKVTISNIQASGANIIKIFNSSNNDSSGSSTLSLTQGLNKIIVSGKTATTDAPDLGNVTFTLKNS
ncbi:hypothetical protein [Mycoplasma bradburyae]|uniref:hypothetical protein n=1 Tax=Mycoplasma bradburyae TaxID=2963128 RepID=UPI002341CFEB|nr:hypothetical protein [Mycoplasma bradburyae]MDC4182866.1 hypothetical protein [Mycoplasma bradburyae]